MKAILVDDVLKLSENFSRKDFPEKSGLYLVDDGKSYTLVTITDEVNGVMIPFSVIIPRDSIIKDYEEVSHKTIVNVEEAVVNLSNQMFSIQNIVSEASKPLPTLEVSDTFSDGVNLTELTKLIEIITDAVLDNKKTS